MEIVKIIFGSVMMYAFVELFAREIENRKREMELNK
ncbi:hypothetical protein N071400001_14960 [Clostridium tetani]|nr:hypothetical protein K154306013_14320 [Clostridium tetani]BDR86888.1 hypothetical protein N071400001_14960 [Clostridium tetani]